MPSRGETRRRSAPRVRWRPWTKDAPPAVRRAILGHQARAAFAWLAWPPLALLAMLRRRTILRSTPVVAVVGSFGKTTTTRAVAAAVGEPLRDPSNRNFWAHLALRLLRAHYLDLAEELLTPANVAARGCFAPRTVDRLLRRLRSGRRRPFDVMDLHFFVLLEGWHRVFIDPPVVTPPADDLLLPGRRAA